MPPVVATMPRTPLIGNLWDLQADRLGFLQEVYRTCGDVGIFYLGLKKIFVFTSPQYAQRILVEDAKSFEKGPILRKFSQPFIGDGLLTCRNSDHLKKRRFLAPSFHRKTLAQFVAPIQKITREAVQWDPGRKVNLYPQMMKLTMRVIGQVLLSMDIEQQVPLLSKAIHVGMKDVSERIRTPLYPPLWLPTKANRNTKKHLAAIDRFFLQIIADRRGKLAQQGADGEPSVDVLSLLIQARDDQGRQLTDREIRDELATLIFAGFETTTNAIAWTMCFLSRHPEVLDRARLEVQQVLGDSPCSAVHLQDLNYVQAVIEESMRIYPPAHTVGRVAAVDMDVCGVPVGKGDIALVCPYLMHRRPDIFPQPEVFQPQRFYDQQMRSVIPKYTYMPFGLGPRSCIGGQLAMIELKIILATLLQAHPSWRLCEDFPMPYTTISIRPRGDIPCLFV
jgi:cytochrome P450